MKGGGEKGGCRTKYRNIARVNLEAAKQKVARGSGGNDLSNAGEDNSTDAQEDRLDNGGRNHDSESYAGDGRAIPIPISRYISEASSDESVAINCRTYLDGHFTLTAESKGRAQNFRLNFHRGIIFQTRKSYLQSDIKTEILIEILYS